MSTPTTTRATVAARRTQAIAMRSAGQSWDTIAAELGYASKGAACTDIKRALAANLAQLAESAEDFRQLELEHLAELRRKAMDVLNAVHVRVSAGVVVRDADPVTGEVTTLTDDEPALRAIDRLVRLAERKARLLGLDAPTRTELTTYDYSINGVEVSEGGKLG